MISELFEISIVLFLKHSKTKDFIEKGFFLCSNVSKVIEMCDGLLFQASSPPVHRNWTEFGSREEARWNLARRMRFPTRRWPFTSIAYFLNVFRRNPYLCKMESSWSENANEGTRSIKLVYIADNLREQEEETFSSTQENSTPFEKQRDPQANNIQEWVSKNDHQK